MRAVAPDSSLDSLLAAQLDALGREGLLRSPRFVESRRGFLCRIGNREAVDFSSNDYLGLSREPALIEAAASAAARFGVGSGASRLISGGLPPHRELEMAVARFKQVPAALAFSSGFAAAMGGLPALAGRGDVVVLDKLAHACLIDAAKATGATLRIFPHNDMERLESLLRGIRDKVPASARIWIVTESVFSMDGDIAPLHEIAALKERYGAFLWVDEAHAIGVLGEGGRGLAHLHGLGGKIEVQMGTMGKALGVCGGYLSGSEELVRWLFNSARSFIFSTAPTPSTAASCAAAIGFLESEAGGKRVRALRDNIAFFCERIGLGEPGPESSAIFPWIVGGEEGAMRVSGELLEKGFFVPPVRFPAVRRGAARLRIAISAGHSPGQLSGLAEALREIPRISEGAITKG